MNALIAARLRFTPFELDQRKGEGHPSMGLGVAAVQMDPAEVSEPAPGAFRDARSNLLEVAIVTDEYRALQFSYAGDNRIRRIRWQLISETSDLMSRFFEASAGGLCDVVVREEAQRQ